MTTRASKALTALVLAALASSCADDEPSGGGSGEASDAQPPSSASPSPVSSAVLAEMRGPCRVTAEQLAEITGTAQSMSTADASGGSLTCETTYDAREVEIAWELGAATEMPSSLEEMRPYTFDDDDTEVTEVDLSHGVRGWLQHGIPVSSPEATVVAVLGDRDLEVRVAQSEGVDTALESDVLAEHALEIARRFAAAHFDDHPNARPTPAPTSESGECLLSDEQLAEAAGVPFTVKGPVAVHPTQVLCQSSWTDGLNASWSWHKSFTPVDEDEQAESLADDGRKAREFELPDGSRGWVVADRWQAQALTVVDDVVLVFDVGVTSGAGEPPSRDELEKQARDVLAVFRQAYVDAGGLTLE